VTGSQAHCNLDGVDAYFAATVLLVFRSLVGIEEEIRMRPFPLDCEGADLSDFLRTLELLQFLERTKSLPDAQKVNDFDLARERSR
jgi:hypothetical protein